MSSSKYRLVEPKGNATQTTLGEGAYGVVYKARDTTTGKMFALKKIKVGVETENEGISSSALRELSLLKQLDHENIVRLEDVEIQPNRLNLIFELIDQDLKKQMDSLNAPMKLDLIQVDFFVELLLCFD